ncbi:MAG: hypothetical protein JSW53_00420 [Candidatus Bathyarchaeota archaeon]|nr:MAG: hypothetical protein JSW53_00420 [Candidatus Bathyarchaeota archaeon]
MSRNTGVSKASGTKTKLEKLTRAVTSAMKYLEISIRVASKGDDVRDLVWNAAANLEYALFLFSIMHQDVPKSSSWRLTSASKEVEVESILASTRDLVAKAENEIKAGALHEARKITWMARGHLLRLQEFFEKQRKLERAAKKSSQ